MASRLRLLCCCHNRFISWQSNRYSSLVEKMTRAAEGLEISGIEEEKKMNLETELDEKGEPFREMFVMPKRKLNVQIQLERLSGRSAVAQTSRPDISDRLAVRRPRAEEMPTDQDWPTVWPVAASFKSSVVPLPIRMGYRPHPEKRPPFKTVGNLELLKIPNFLHLTPDAIERHCQAIKKYCTEWPKELVEDAELLKEHFPITLSYSDYVHQGTSLRDMRARICTLTVKVSSLNLDQHSKEKLMRLAGDRYDEKTDILTITTDRCYTRKQNRDYAMYLLTVLYHESLKREEWEKMAQRTDDLKVRFKGSTVEKRIRKLKEKQQKEQSEDHDEHHEVSDKNVKVFADMWERYRNEPETPESTREYDRVVRKLLGIPCLEESSSNRQRSESSHS